MKFPYISMEISYKIKNLPKIENSLRWSSLISYDKLSSINTAFLATSKKKATLYFPILLL